MATLRPPLSQRRQLSQSTISRAPSVPAGSGWRRGARPANDLDKISDPYVFVSSALRPFAFAARLAAQYFFILRLTAKRAARDILPRRVREALTPSVEDDAGPPRTFVPLAPARPFALARLGNTFNRSESSDCNSRQRTSAPRRARSRSDDECFGMMAINCRRLSYAIQQP